jgi:hypothetical protein
MKTTIAFACVCSLMVRLAQAEILFDLDPNVPDLLSLEITRAPDIPPEQPEFLWEQRASMGWDWSVITLRPIPAGTLDVARITVAAQSELETKLQVQGWAGPPTMVLDGTPIIAEFEKWYGDMNPEAWRKLPYLQVFLVSQTPNTRNEINLLSLRVDGAVQLIPEPSAGVSAIAALALHLAIVRRARRRSHRDRSPTS